MDYRIEKRNAFQVICKKKQVSKPQSSAYEYGNGIELEVYPSADVQDPDYTCEIWIAVNEKK